MRSWKSRLKSVIAGVGAVDMRVAEHRAADLHAALVGRRSSAALPARKPSTTRLKSSGRSMLERCAASSTAFCAPGMRSTMYWPLLRRGRRIVRADHHQRRRLDERRDGRARPCRGWRRSSRHSRRGRSRGSSARMRFDLGRISRCRNAGVNQRSTTPSDDRLHAALRHRLDARVPHLARRHVGRGVAEREAREAAADAAWRAMHPRHAAHREAAEGGLRRSSARPEDRRRRRRGARACSSPPALPIFRGRAGRSG